MASLVQSAITNSLNQTLQGVTEGSDAGNEEESDDGKDAEKKKRALMTKIVQAVCVISVALHVVIVVTNISDFDETSGMLGVLSGATGVALAVAVFFFQFLAKDESDMRELQNGLREEMGGLDELNTEMAANLESLTSEVTRLQEQEERLQAISNEQGTNVDNLVQLVKENQSILDAMHAQVKKDTVQTLFSAIISCDLDNDLTFDDNELRLIETRVMAIPGVKFNRRRFEDAVQKSDRGLANLLGIARELEDDTIPEDQRIFVFMQDKITKKKKKRAAAPKK